MLLRRTVLRCVPLFAMMLAPAAGFAQSVDYDASEQLFGEPVTSSATGKPQRVSQAPVDIEIIDAARIARSGARTLPDVLEFVTGVDVRRYGMQDQAVGIRGYNTPLIPRVLVLLDGRQVYLDDYGMTVWSAIPVSIDQIQQIEIIKGPNAALYGFNAVSGVINIITRNPLQHPQNSISAQGGTQNQASGDAVTTVGRPERWAVRLATQGEHSNEFADDDAGAQRRQPRSGTVSVDAHLRLAPTFEWDLSGAITSVDSSLFIDLGVYAPVLIRTNTVGTGLSWDTALGLMHVRAYRNEERLANAFTLGADSYRDDLLVTEADDLFKHGAHAFRIATEYRNNDAASFNTFRGHIGYQDVAASSMWEWTLSPRVQFTNAVRTDVFFLDYHGDALDIPGLGTLVHASQLVEPSFNSGLVIRLDGGSTIRLSAARAAQLPSLLDYGFQYRIGPAYVTGNADLRPAVVTNYEIDWQHDLPAVRSTLRISAFEQHADTTVGAAFGSGITVLPSGNIVLMSRNFGASAETGGVIAIKGELPDGLRWDLSYALAAVDDYSSDAALRMVSSISYARQTPTSTVLGGIGYRWRRLDLDLQARWQSRFQDFRFEERTISVAPVTISNALTMRLHAGYQLGRHVAASLTLDQLNRSRLVQTAGAPVPRQLYGGVRVSF